MCRDCGCTRRTGGLRAPLAARAHLPPGVARPAVESIELITAILTGTIASPRTIACTSTSLVCSRST
jgi:hypothetical protein